MIRQEWKYPREDIVELRDRFNSLEDKVRQIEDQLNLEQPYSLTATQQRFSEETYRVVCITKFLNYCRVRCPPSICNFYVEQLITAESINWRRNLYCNSQ